MKLIDLAYEVLKKADAPLSYKEIWNRRSDVIASDSEIEYKGNTEEFQVIYSSINQEITTKEKPRFYKTSKNPVLFGLVEKNYSATVLEEATAAEEKKDGKNANGLSDYNEADLHPILVKYLAGDQHFMCLTKTIAQQKAKKVEKGLDDWTYPDLIGVHFPFGELHKDTIEILSVLEVNPIRFFSFEMKKELTIGNLRKCYFQAVSNSSWATEGYLVAPQIDESEDFIQELALLNNAFGIGVIKLNPGEPAQSKILFQSAVKKSLDINMLNKLIDRSEEVKQLFEIVKNSMKINKVDDRDKFDKVIEDEEYLTTFQKYGIKGFQTRKK